MNLFFKLSTTKAILDSNTAKNGYFGFDKEQEFNFHKAIS